MLSGNTKNLEQKFHSPFIHPSSSIRPCKSFIHPGVNYSPGLEALVQCIIFKPNNFFQAGISDTVLLRFDDFNIEPGETCEFDSLEISDRGRSQK